MSTLKLNCNLGNFGGPVQGPVPKLGPVLVLGPQDRSGPDRLQTLATHHCIVLVFLNVGSDVLDSCFHHAAQPALSVTGTASGFP